MLTPLYPALRPQFYIYRNSLKDFLKQGLEAVAFIEKDTNNVVIVFEGFSNQLASQLFITFAMVSLGFDYETTENMPSKSIH